MVVAVSACKIVVILADEKAGEVDSYNNYSLFTWACKN
jgi:hypothetical protein